MIRTTKRSAKRRPIDDDDDDDGDVLYVCRYCAEYEVVDAKPGCQSATSAAPWTRPLMRGAVACVECQSVAMRRRLGNRCRGHGVVGRRTRWNAATAPGCSGRWTMTSARRPCRCNPDSQLSFIFI